MQAQYKTYDSYKDSGVPWLGKIPKDWEVTRNLGLFDERKDVNFPEAELLSVTIEQGIIKQSEITAKKDSSNEDKRKYKRVLPDDLAYNKMRMWQGAIGRSQYEGIVSPAYIILEPRNKAYSRFYHYLYRTSIFIKEANRNSYGLCDDMNSLRYEDFKTIHSPVPPEDQVNRIVAFLDQKTAEIDSAIEKKQRLIELLKEQKSILINQAVTKGLNPSAPMKDSGIEWIGQIPAHWEVKRVKRVAHVSPSKGADGVKKAGLPVTFLAMESISETGDIDCSEKKAVKDIFEGFTYFRKNDVVIAKITPCFENGKGAYLSELDTEFGFGTTELHVLRPKKVRGDFLFLLLNRKAFLIQGEEFMVGSAGQKRIPTSFVANYLFGMPPEPEQEQIARHCSELNGHVANLINKELSGIEKLQEFKQTLIAHAVTGKIKV